MWGRSIWHREMFSFNKTAWCYCMLSQYRETLSVSWLGQHMYKALDTFTATSITQSQGAAADLRTIGLSLNQTLVRGIRLAGSSSYRDTSILCWRSLSVFRFTFCRAAWGQQDSNQRPEMSNLRFEKSHLTKSNAAKKYLATSLEFSLRIILSRLIFRWPFSSKCCMIRDV